MPGVSLLAATLLHAGAAGAAQFAPGPPETAPTVRIARAQSGVVHEMGAEVLEIAYGRLGYRVEFVVLPAKRSVKAADAGLVDAEVGRIPGAELRFPNLVPLRSTPIAHVTGVAYAIDRSTVVDRWSDLRGLRVGIRRGELHAELGTDGLAPHVVDSCEQLFGLLVSGRVDTVITLRENAARSLRRYFPGAPIREAGESLSTEPIYHLVHRRRLELLDELAPVLARMQADGEIAAIRRRVLARDGPVLAGGVGATH